MLRIAAALGTILAATACSGGAKFSVDDVLPSGYPTASDLTELRAVDVCALLPRSSLADFGPVTAVGTDTLYSCDALIGRSDNAIELSWNIVASPVYPENATTEIAGAAADVNTDNDNPDAEYIRVCGVTADLTDGSSLYLTTTTPVDTSACELATKAATEVLAVWPTRPELGTSPDTVLTAVTGLDPCVAVEDIEEAHITAVQWLDRCWFTFEGEKMYVAYGHEPDRAFPNYDATSVDGRTAYATEGDSLIAPVEPAFDPAADGYAFTSVPAVTVGGGSAEARERVLRQVLGLFPQ